jgi:hypothetical protein
MMFPSHAPTTGVRRERDGRQRQHVAPAPVVFDPLMCPLMSGTRRAAIVEDLPAFVPQTELVRLGVGRLSRHRVRLVPDVSGAVLAVDVSSRFCTWPKSGSIPRPACVMARRS